MNEKAANVCFIVVWDKIETVDSCHMKICFLFILHLSIDRNAKTV